MAIIYIESNTTGFGQNLLDISSKYDDVYFIVRDTARYPFLKKPSPVNVIQCDTSSLDGLATAVARINGIRYIASTSDAYIEIVARLNEYLGLLGNSGATVEVCRDKLRLQDVLRDNNIRYPRTTLAHARDQVLGLVFPIILKPRKGTGSIGVRLIESVDAFPVSLDADFICQAFIGGQEFSVETFSDSDGHHVLGVTRKFVTKPPHFLELAHVFPADINATLHKRIAATVRRALNAVGYAFGPAHTEVKVYDGEVYIIEINARLAGGMIPRLMERAYGWSVPDLYVRSHLAQRSQFFASTPHLYSSVAFVIPQTGRHYIGIDFPSDCADAGMFRAQGVNEGKFDFSDRAGYVISVGRTETAAVRQSISLRTRSVVVYANHGETEPSAATIRKIVYEGVPIHFGTLIDSILTIEKAHLTMLREQSIISAQQFSIVKNAVLALESEPTLLREHVSGRGEYFDYEHYIISRCGLEVGGMIQTARSRNDINSTHLLLVIRDALSAVSRRTIAMIDTIAKRAEETADLLLPIYSQFQTAMPGSAGHYLVAQCQIMLGTLEMLHSIRDHLTESPLGACAGAGTSFATDTQLTATLLGFTKGPINSLSAISDKNNALRCSYLFAELSGNINRVATDLQLWSMREIGIVSFPDAIYGGSSNMPQKRNPYLLEWLRLGHERNIGRLMTVLSSLSHLPTGNSYQASRTAVETIIELANPVTEMLTVLIYAINNIRFDSDASQTAITKGFACATLAAELLVQKRITSFREAHLLIGQLLASERSDELTPALASAAALLESVNADLAHEPIFNRLVGGGGPSTTNTLASLTQLQKRLFDASRRQQSYDMSISNVQNSLNQRFLSMH